MKNSKTTYSNLKDLKVLIVDDHELYSIGLQKLLSIYPFISKCDKAENGLVALGFLKTESYDIVFLDIQMPKMDGLTLAKRIRKDYAATKIIVMTAHEKKSYVYEFLELGVSAYLIKYCIADEVVRAFEVVMDGGTYINSEIKAMYNEYLLEKKEEEDRNGNSKELSKTEKVVASLICEQLNTDEISARMGKSKSTINTYRKRIFKKLKIINSVGIAIYAIKRGFFNP